MGSGDFLSVSLILQSMFFKRMPETIKCCYEEKLSWGEE